MKTLLINPQSNAPNSVMPLGLAYIAAALEKASIHVEVIDAWAEGYSFVKLGREIAKRNCDIIGVSVMSPLYATGMRTVDIAKQNSKAKIVVGGPHPTALPEECLKDNRNIDFVVIGEGEKVFIDLIRTLQNGNRELDKIKGLAFWRNGDIINTGHAERLEDLNNLPFPARHLFPVEKYKTHPPFGKRNPYMTIFTSRGCPFQCTYCSKSVFGSRYRAMSPQRICEEMHFLIREYGAREVHFYDDDFTIDMKRAEAVCEEIIRQKLRICWSCTTRVDLVDENLLRKMKMAGCWLISYGVESGNSTILKNIKKGYTLDQVEKTFDLTKRLGIRTVAYFMLGLPGETEDTIRETIDFSLRLNPDFVSWGITSLYPGSELYQKAQNGELGENITVRYTQEDKSWHSSASPYGDGFAIIYEDKISREQLRKHSQKANKSFYLRPLYVLKLVFKICSLRELLIYLKGGIQFLAWVRK